MAEPPRILLVEDEPMIAFALEDMVLDMGYRVVGPAYRLSEALALTEAETFDGAVLDVNLNEERSFPVAERLRERGIPFLFATGYAESGVGGRGEFTVLAKPYGRAQLANALAAMLA